MWSKSIIVPNLFNQSHRGRLPVCFFETDGDPLANCSARAIYPVSDQSNPYASSVA